MGKMMLSAMLKPALLTLAIAFGTLSPAVARAETLLTINSAAGQESTFSRADLDAMPRISFTTGTTWTEGTLTAFYTVGGFTLFRCENVSLSAQPSGTSVRWRVDTTTGIEVDAVSLKWRN